VTGFFEDIEIGPVIQLGSHAFTSDEIISFAKRFDPQPFHLSEEAARDSLFGHLCASGWHTACVWMRLMTAYHTQLRDEIAAEGGRVPNYGPSPGIHDLTWPAPVYVNDVVRFTTQVRQKRTLNSRPGWGVIESYNEGINQDGAAVLRFYGNLFVERRERSPASDRAPAKS
jgi:acyl dehydratase